MPEEFPYDVFLSHQSGDKARVLRLAERLREAGLRVWMDEWVILPGDIIPLKVEEGLELSRALLLCVSRAALDSGWVALERSTAIHRDPANRDRRFIPLLLEDCDLPGALRIYKYVDYREESDAAFTKVLAACRPGSKPDPPAPPPGRPRFSAPSGESAPDRRRYEEELERLRAPLEIDLNRIDSETEWSDAAFVDLEARIVVTTAGRWRGFRRRRVGDLLDALRGNRDRRFFLVLGDPGSGKSVSLRKLTRDLLKKEPLSRRVPVYMNLRDWRTPPEWARHASERPASAPAEAEICGALEEWIRRDLARRVDPRGREFLDRHFDRMMREGNFFFLLDSFDEIGLLLGVEEKHPLVDAFSGGIALFLSGTHGSRGLLASRPFRKPTAAFDAPCELEICPLTPNRVEDFALRRSAPPAFCERLARDPSGLAAAARNPFTAALLMEYVAGEVAAGKTGAEIPVPENRGVLFERFVAKRAAADRREDPERLVAALSEIAGVMYSRAGSFELDRAELPERLAGLERGEALQALARGRLLRLGAEGEGGGRVSFTHRRFAEYMIARRWMDRGRGPAEGEPAAEAGAEGKAETEEALPLEDIPRDSLWRDTLVLYCECAGTEAARRVAEFCVAELRGGFAREGAAGEADRRRRLHILRFFSEAFRGRPEPLEEWEEELFAMVRKTLEEGNALLIKWSLEMAGTLRDDHYSAAVRRAVDFKEPWLLETVFRQTGRLGSLPPEVLEKLRVYIDILSYLRLWRDWRELRFVLGAHPELRPLHRHLVIPFAHSLLWPASLAAALLFLRIEQVYLLLAASVTLYSVRVIPFREYAFRNSNHLVTFVGMVISLHYVALTVLSAILFYARQPVAALIFLIPMPLPKMVWVVTGPYAGNPLARCLRGLWTGFKRIPLLLLAGGFLVMMLKCVDGLNYLLAEARKQSTWEMRLLYGFLPGLVLLVFVAAGAAMIFGVARAWGNDACLLADWWRRRREQTPVTRETISAAWRALRTPWAKLLLVRSLEKLRSVTGEWDGPPPYASPPPPPEKKRWFHIFSARAKARERSRLKGPGAAAFRLARLDERWRGLA